MKKIVLHLILVFSSFVSLSQTKSEKNLGSWYVLYANHTISNNWSILTGFEERNYQAFQNYNLTLYSLATNYKVSKKTLTTLGYMYLDIDRTFDPDVDPNTKENRFYEQLLFKTKYFKIPFSHRIRVEQRFLNSMGIKTNINRLRYRLKTNIPLNKKIYLTIGNESFINFKGKLYPENRFTSAIGFKISKNISIEAGYLGHYINNLHLDRIQVGLYFKTDLRKKAKS